MKKTARLLKSVDGLEYLEATASWNLDARWGAKVDRCVQIRLGERFGTIQMSGE